MSKYTIELKRVCELVGRDTVESYFTDYNLSDYLTSEQINVINNANIWSKEKLAKKIVDHYFTREIGAETIGLFKHFAKITMQEIMEKKLHIIYSNSIKFDPIVNVDYKEEYTRNIDATSNSTGKSNSTSNSNGSNLQINADTPQTNINKDYILNGNYASSAIANETDNSITDNSNTEANGTNNSVENYTRRKVGNDGISATTQALLKQYRDTLVAVDEDIINELNVLFMGLW